MVQAREGRLDLLFFLLLRQFQRFDARPLGVFLLLDVVNDLTANVLEGADQEAA